MQDNKEKLNNILKIFKINAEIENVIQSSRITRYELKIQPQQRLSSITKLAGEIGVAFGTPNNVRISPVYGKEYIVGIEIPNAEEPASDTEKTITTFTLGENIDGKIVTADIAQMPHLLIGGTTGSGKSVFLNSLITSLLANASPKDLRFLMIDPKRVELALYNNIPHLLCPIVKEPTEAKRALSWAAVEMDRRYALCESAGVREFEHYNQKMTETGGETLPRIIIVIDELAELIMSSESRLNGNLKTRNEIETLICRIAAKARASGIHLVVATQRPSKDIITGLIRDNLPSKVALTVADGVASKIILDETGAEKLLGKGDMLFKPVGAMKVERIQGKFISDEDVEAIAKYVISKNEPVEYNSELVDKIENKPKHAAANPERIQRIAYEKPMTEKDIRFQEFLKKFEESRRKWREDHPTPFSPLFEQFYNDNY